MSELNESQTGVYAGFNVQQPCTTFNAKNIQLDSWGFHHAPACPDCPPLEQGNRTLIIQSGYAHVKGCKHLEPTKEENK